MRTRRRQQGFSLIELLIVIAIILVILSVAIPGGDKVLMNSRETAVIREIGSIHQAQTQYLSQFGHYAATLKQLGPPATGSANREAADLIPQVLAEGQHNGYVYTVEAGLGGYAVRANPETFGSSGRRTFFSDQTLVIRHNWSQEPATAESPTVGDDK